MILSSIRICIWAFTRSSPDHGKLYTLVDLWLNRRALDSVLYSAEG